MPHIDAPFISLRNVSLRFITYRDKRTHLKEAMVGKLLRRLGGLRPSNEHFWAMRDFDLHVESGDRLGVIGPNGAGKSTMLRVIAGVYAPTTGCIEVNGGVAPLIDIGAGFNHEVSAYENIILYGALLGFSRHEMEARADGILTFAGVEEFAAMPTKYYSVGMLRRLAFSAATDITPDVLLIDEVFAGGDVQFHEKAKQRMLELIDNAKVMVMVSHQLPLIKDLCTRVIWVDKGRIRLSGNPEEVIEAYLEEVGTGKPAANQTTRAA